MTSHINSLIPPATVYKPARRNWQNTLKNALVITRRELRDSLRDWRIMVPIFLLTLISPLLAQGMTQLTTDFFVRNGAAPMLDNFLPLLPMIVGFFPISISLVIALETFVGEKERRSLEPLLSTPLSNIELYIGKTLAAMLPPLMASGTGILIYLVTLILGERQWRPELELIIQILLLTAAQALVMVTGAVVISSQTTSTRASNLLASFIIIPMSLLVMLESFTMVTNKRFLLWYILVGLIAVDLILFITGARMFNREDLLGKTIDNLNLRWFWKQFKGNFRGDPRVHSIASWYRYSVWPVLPKLRKPILVVLIAMIGMFLFGPFLDKIWPEFTLPTTTTLTREQTIERFRAMFQLGNTPKNDVRLAAVAAVVMQNMRVLGLALLLGAVSFGIASIFLAGIPMTILGYLSAQPILAVIGISGLLAAIVPHSLVEIPAIILSVAASLRLGAMLTRPPKETGLWEAWVANFADAIKINLGLVIPMLIVAAFIEVFITPQILLRVIGG